MKPVMLQGRRDSVAPFFLLTFAVSWLIWIPLALSHLGLGPLSIPRATSDAVRLLGVLAPAIMAFICAARFGGRRGVADLSRLVLRWRVGVTWWVLALALYPAVLLAAAGLYTLLRRQPALTPVSWPDAGALAFTVVILAIASAGEEIGWRGYALPRLQSRFSALGASLVLGTIWTLWHLPFWLLQDSFTTYGPGYMVLNWLAILPIAILITWIVNNARGSALLAWVFHLTGNIVNVAYMLITSTLEAYYLVVLLSWAVALVVVAVYGPQRLTRSRTADAGARTRCQGAV